MHFRRHFTEIFVFSVFALLGVILSVCIQTQLKAGVSSAPPALHLERVWGAVLTTGLVGVGDGVSFELMNMGDPFLSVSF